MLRAHVFNALLLCVSLTAQVFPTADPIMPPSSGAMLPLTPAEYQKFAAAAEGLSNIKVIRQLPPNLSPDYRLGYNFVYESANHGWILDRDSEGYKLFLDLRGDGDLSWCVVAGASTDTVRRVAGPTGRPRSRSAGTRQPRVPERDTASVGGAAR
jgi:hypothetical protein